MINSSALSQPVRERGVEEESSVLMAIARGHIIFKTPDGCHPSGEMDFEESDRLTAAKE